MNRPWLLIPLALTIPGLVMPALARPNPQELPRAAQIEQFGERQLLELRPNPDGSPEPYVVYALTVPGATPGHQMMPLDAERRPVNTSVWAGNLHSNTTEHVTKEYQIQQTAYLRVDFHVAVPRGYLLHNGQTVLRMRPQTPHDGRMFAWGLGWVATGGLVSFFGVHPINAQNQTYTVAIPLNSGVHRIEYIGGNIGVACPAQDHRHTLYLDSSRLRPGAIYHLQVDVACAGGIAGIVGRNRLIIQPFRIYWGIHEGLESSVQAPSGQWREFIYAGGNRGLQPVYGNTRCYDDNGNPYTCRRQLSGVNEMWFTEDLRSHLAVVRSQMRDVQTTCCDNEGNQITTVGPWRPVALGEVVPWQRCTTTRDSDGAKTTTCTTLNYRLVYRSHPSEWSMNLLERSHLSGTVERRLVTRTDAYGQQFTAEELVINPDPGPQETIRIVNRWERVPVLNLHIWRENYTYDHLGHNMFVHTSPPETSLLRDGTAVWNGSLGQHTLNLVPRHTYSLNRLVGQAFRVQEDQWTRLYWRVHHIGGLPLTAQVGQTYTGQLIWRPRLCQNTGSGWQCQDH